MADKTKTTKTLSAVAGFADGDDRTLTIDNPNTSINLTSELKKLGTWLKENQVILGDKTGAAFTNFKSAKIQNKTVTYFDLA